MRPPTALAVSHLSASRRSGRALRSARVCDAAETTDRRSPETADTIGRTGGSVERPALAPPLDCVLPAVVAIALLSGITPVAASETDRMLAKVDSRLVVQCETALRVELEPRIATRVGPILLTEERFTKKLADGSVQVSQYWGRAPMQAYPCCREVGGQPTRRHALAGPVPDEVADRPRPLHAGTTRNGRPAALLRPGRALVQGRELVRCSVEVA